MKERFEKFTVLINKISRNIRKIKNQEMAEYGLRATHVSCLYYLYAAESLTATELCERCEEDKATISRSIDYLEENGFCFCEKRFFFRAKIIPIKGRVDYKSVNWEFQFDKIIRIWTIDQWLQLT